MADENTNKLKISELQNKALELSLFLSLPASFALIIASEEITSSLFGYGSFDIESVKNSAKALFYFSLGSEVSSLERIMNFIGFDFSPRFNFPLALFLLCCVSQVLASLV